jgi:hypothetical protein
MAAFSFLANQSESISAELRPFHSIFCLPILAPSQRQLKAINRLHRLRDGET